MLEEFVFLFPVLLKQWASWTLSILAYGTGIFSVLFSLASVFAAHRLWRKRPLENPPTEYPPITVLKPIKDIDQGMYGNLASFLSQDYPNVQTIFCLQSSEDPALPLLQRLRQDFQNSDIEIVISPHRIGYNPKINNLSNAAPFIKHDLLLISDSDIWAQPNLLRRLVVHLAHPSVGLVTCFYQARFVRGLWAIFEALAVNAQFLPQAAVAAGLLGMRFAMGAVMLIPKKVLEASGGFAHLSKHLADDYTLGTLVQDLGLRIALAEPVVTSVPDHWGWKKHFSHLIRWSRTIRVCQPAGYFASALLHATTFLCLHLLFNSPTKASLMLLGAVLCARAGSLAWIHAVVLKNFEIFKYLYLLPISDLLQSVIWFLGFVLRKVFWRGEAYYIHARGELIPIEDAPVRPAIAPG